MAASAVFNLIGRRRWWYALSLAVILPGLVALYAHHVHDHHALNWGVDFTGGNSLELRITQPFTVGDIRQIMGRFQMADAIIQRSGDTEVFIRTRPLSQAQTNAIIDAVTARFPSTKMLRQDTVGPEIGAELRNVAIFGVAIGLILQVVFISFRFHSVRFAIAADIALLHDLLVVIGAFAITQREVNSSFLAVLLTVAGYSINDTIVIFDRVRENQKAMRAKSLEEVMNLALNQCLGRTIITSGTVFLTVLALFVFGGEVINDFAFLMLIGTIEGVYSTVYLSCPVVLFWQKWFKPKNARRR
jgi:preprotein translocase subunit SecF